MIGSKHASSCLANGVCYSDRRLSAIGLPFQWLYFSASNAWIAFSPLSVTSKVSDGWGSAFSTMPMYKSALDVSFSCVHEWVSHALLFFFFLSPYTRWAHCIASRSFSWAFGVLTADTVVIVSLGSIHVSRSTIFFTMILSPKSPKV